MKRRSFIKSTGAASFVTLITPGSIVHAMRQVAEGTLEQSFKKPPHAAKPFTWWHWMNGNVTKEGITLDLEAMERVGIGGVQCFNVGSGIPKGPVDYLGKEWVDLTNHAIREAGRLGLEFDIHNCPGWSSTGGPWITPELAMQQVVWSETVATGGQKDITLPKPFSKLDFYKDTYVLAFPTLKGEQQSTYKNVKNISTNKGDVNRELLSAPDLTKGVGIETANAETPGYLLYEFNEPFEARSVAVYSSPLAGAAAGGRVTGDFILESSNDGKTFTRVSEFSRSGNNIEQAATGSFAPVTAKYFRLSIHQPLTVADVRLSPAHRITNWAYKANYPGQGGSGSSLRTTASFLTYDTTVADAGSVIDPSAVVDVTKFMSADGKLNWDVPTGTWTILRFGHTPTGRRNNAPPESGAGLECDKYSREAYDFHFDKMFENLLPVMKEILPKSKVGVLVDSYEVGMQNWTPKMAEEFSKRRGYDFVKYLPAMTGRVVGTVETTERFLWDLRRTHADMMVDNYHGYFAELCKKHGLLSYTEPYNNGPFEQMQVGSRVDINMGEFWIRGPHFFPSVKLASSIAHVFGKRLNGRQIVGAESFTGDAVHSKWQESPYALKAQGDYMYTKGLNRFIFHRYAHQPHPTAVPGMTMGPWGFHFDRTNTWFEKGKKWLEYVSRCQSVLQQGLFVADILYFTGEDAPGEDFSMMGTPNPAPPKGYDYDFINKEAVLNRIKIKNGSISFADGLTYQIMVLPEKGTMTVEVMQKLTQLVKEGMVLVGKPPVRTPGLAASSGDDELKKLIEQVWGSTTNAATGERSVGAGKVFWGFPLQQVVSRLNIKPDCEFSVVNDAPIHYIHRTIKGAEVYFVANKRRTSEEVVATFRVTGKRPEIWNADTGEITPVDIYEIAGDRIKVPLQFDPAGSFFVVFRTAAEPTHLLSIEKQAALVVSTKARPVSKVGMYADVTNNFTVTAWVKPETEENWNSRFALERGLASNVFYPVEGELVYGKGHVACGLIAARNGLLVYERSTGTPVNVLVAPAALSGWSHIALTYKNGAPSIYLNGKLVKEGTASGKIVHPGLHENPQDYLSWFFEGDMEKLELHKQVLSEQQLQQMFALGQPLPQAPLPVQVAANAKGGLLFWQDGSFSLQNSVGKRQTVNVTGTANAIQVNAPWTVRFPAGLGAPPEITLAKLASLHLHNADGVKYFSGTATYTTSFSVPTNAISANKKLFLDLGRVEVLADVKVNGRALGILWKPPYRLDVTNVVKPGDNDLEIEVTNLWPNRLIGDEQLPAENEYGNTSGGGVGNTSSGGAVRKLPDWYLQGKPKPAGGRITFATWKHYQKDAPLLESGLIGPVVLRTAHYHPLT